LFLRGRSRRWTVLELVERFKSLGVCASRASVTAALVELDDPAKGLGTGPHLERRVLLNQKTPLVDSGRVPS
jgi:hypothetical protein